jgi:hypothetical protein
MSDLPPFGDATDEAVSASIDGELDDFAAAQGIAVDEVARRLLDWGGFGARRHELAGARAAVATEAPPLDPLTRRQFVHHAKSQGLTASKPRGGRSPRVWRPIIGVAAAVAVAAAAFGLSRLGGGSSGGTSASRAAKAAPGPQIQKGAFVGAVGDVSEPTTLRTLLTTTSAGLPVHTAEGAAAVAPQRATGQPASPSSALRQDDGRAAALRCATIVDPIPAGESADTVVLLATAMFHGHDAVVIGVRRGARSIVFVADRASCAVLTSQSV